MAKGRSRVPRVQKGLQNDDSDYDYDDEDDRKLTEAWKFQLNFLPNKLIDLWKSFLVEPREKRKLTHKHIHIHPKSIK